jgi:hypothetical protein
MSDTAPGDGLTTLQRALRRTATASVLADEAANHIEHGEWAAAAVALAEAALEATRARLELAATQDTGSPHGFLARTLRAAKQNGEPLG